MSAQSEIKDYVEGFYDGPHATPKESDHGPIFLGIKNVTPDGRLDFSEIRHVSPEEFPRWTKRVVPQKDDIVFSYEATLHRYALIPEGFIGCLGRRMALIRPDRAKINPRFLHYYMLSSAWRKEAEASIISGATVDRIPLTKVPNFKVDFPPLTQQEIIAEILSCYDDLIENNKRRIELLEESARQLYKEWFVRFRFPGHEHVKIINGVPEGWQRLKISDLCTVGRGASPRPIQNYMDGEIPWFKIADATASESPFIFETKEKVIESGAQKSVYLPEGELILSNSATCGVPNFTGVKGCIHDGWLYFKGLNTVHKWFLYLYLVFQQRALLQGIGEGATQKNLNTTYVGNQVVTIPGSDTLLQSFTDLVEPVFMQIKTLAIYNRQLSQARDLLLPKLMKGEIAV